MAYDDTPEFRRRWGGVRGKMAKHRPPRHVFTLEHAARRAGIGDIQLIVETYHKRRKWMLWFDLRGRAYGKTVLVNYRLITRTHSGKDKARKRIEKYKQEYSDDTGTPLLWLDKHYGSVAELTVVLRRWLLMEVRDA